MSKSTVDLRNIKNRIATGLSSGRTQQAPAGAPASPPASAPPSASGASWREPGYKFPHQRPDHQFVWDPVKAFGEEPWERPTTNPFTGNKLSYSEAQKVGRGYTPPLQQPDINPFELYYSPDQVADERGNLRAGLSPWAPFRGESAFARAHGYTPPPHQVETYSGRGGGRGGAAGRPAIPYKHDVNVMEKLMGAMPQFERMEYTPVERDFVPPPPAGEPPARPERDREKYMKLLGL